MLLDGPGGGIVGQATSMAQFIVSRGRAMQRTMQWMERKLYKTCMVDIRIEKDALRTRGQPTRDYAQRSLGARVERETPWNFRQIRCKSTDGAGER